MQIDGNTKLIGFFGTTYKTSKMYAMYNAAIEAMGLNYIYVPFAVSDLEKAVAGIRNLGVTAIGITIPYKIDIMKYLDELDANAKRIGAVSVVLNKDGKLIGGNTDGEGALKALKEKTEIKNKKVVLLGSGGAARSIAFALSDEGCHITILNRTESNAKELAAAVGDSIKYGGFDSLPEALKDSEIVINTTPVGMANTSQEGQSIVPAKLLRSDVTVMDIVSKPRETKLLQDASKRGCTLVYGYRMLLWQGVSKFAMYTDVEPPIEVMEEAMENIK
ncbi:MAG: shikimate dehydrogenase [Candidatus Electrothrix sp. LOE2]|nr:shikimate dehydrogenase [Candidatus Electrothrix sp. LOE2]